MEKQIVPTIPVAVEISMYPLRADYEAPILDFIRALRHNQNLSIHTNALSTQISGPFSEVFPTIQKAMAETMLAEGAPVMSFVLKVLNVDVTPGETVNISE